MFSPGDGFLVVVVVFVFTPFFLSFFLVSTGSVSVRRFLHLPFFLFLKLFSFLFLPSSRL